MARYMEARQLLLSGLYPSGIAAEMDVSCRTVIGYLRICVGEDQLRLTDLYFSYPPDKRQVMQEATSGGFPDDGLLGRNSLTRDDLGLFEAIRSSHSFLGDMYEHVAVIEVNLHGLVRAHLEREYGSSEAEWWREGIPKNIRAKCATRREEDDDPSDTPYAYTTLIELWSIISKKWARFSSEVPTAYQSDKPSLKAALDRLNRIRNCVMHPVKERRWNEEDFEFVRELRRRFGWDSTEPGQFPHGST